MPEKDGDEAKSTKSVVNKKQKQMMGEMRQEKKIIPSGQGLTDYSKVSIPSVRELGGLGGGGGGTNSITDKSQAKSLKNSIISSISSSLISHNNISSKNRRLQHGPTNGLSFFKRLYLYYI